MLPVPFFLFVALLPACEYLDIFGLFDPAVVLKKLQMGTKIFQPANKTLKLMSFQKKKKKFILTMLLVRRTHLEPFYSKAQIQYQPIPFEEDLFRSTMSVSMKSKASYGALTEPER